MKSKVEINAMNESYAPRLAGQTVMVTGATSGIGLEVAVTLARGGADTVIVGRNPAKTEAVLADIKHRAGSEKVEAMLCDFASQADIRRFAAEFLEGHKRLDVLVNNAGSVFASRSLTKKGIEKTFAVNHLGSFLLTNLLLDMLCENAPARIVNVASVAHYRGSLDFGNLNFDHGYRIMRAYSRSKLANVLFTRALARRLEGSGVTANAVHPGEVATSIWDGAPVWTHPIFAVIKRLFMVTPAVGAEPVARLAASPDVKGDSGLYFDRDQPKEPSELARDDGLAERLWAESARLTGLDNIEKSG